MHNSIDNMIITQLIKYTSEALFPFFIYEIANAETKAFI